MKYLIDTDIIIYWLKGNEKIEAKAVSVGLEHIAFSIISKAELYFGAHNSEHISENLDNIQIISETISLLPFDEAAADSGMIMIKIHFSESRTDEKIPSQLGWTFDFPILCSS